MTHRQPKHDPWTSRLRTHTTLSSEEYDQWMMHLQQMEAILPNYDPPVPSSVCSSTSTKYCTWKQVMTIGGLGSLFFFLVSLKK